ncbi:stress response protein nst1-like isoform X1 [Gouania willdenowi]|uniref:stress response protein nst1-like isoform X1 n=1 Tax=Gouania willdenowi TaxID=441366 RepID=UPI001054794E|nr:stress response protein nst1-like isoform X1 [Gouania willdenowi]
MKEEEEEGMVDLAGPSQQLEGNKYKWTEEDTCRLIIWRSQNEYLFTGRRNAAQKGFETFIKDHHLEGKVEAGWAKKKWENLKQKYKELKAPRTEVSTEGGETTAATWKWFDAMDEVMKYSRAKPHHLSGGSCGFSSKRREKKDVDLLAFLREMEEREEQREKRAEEREERRERERREEERRYMERREREWREWMDSRAREGEARENESRKREERMMALIESLVKK